MKKNLHWGHYYRATAKEETSKVWMLFRLTNATFITNADEAMGFADKALTLSEKLNI